MAVLTPQKPASEQETQLQTAYSTWSAQRTPQAAGQFVSAAMPIIENQLKTLGQVNPIMRSSAKALLVDMLPRYDASRGVPLTHWTFQQLQPLYRLRAQSSSIVPIAERAQQQLAAVHRARRELSDKLGYEPDDDTLADHLKISPRRLVALQKMDISVRPESSFVDDTGTPSLPGTNRPTAADMWSAFVYHDLDPIDRKIYDDVVAGVPKVEIAKRLKISPSAVTQRSNRIGKQLSAFYDAARP